MKLIIACSTLSRSPYRQMEQIDKRRSQIQRAIREEREQEHWNEVHEQLLSIQKKSLEVSHPDDADEKEADEVARKVMGGESAEIHGTGGTINRKGEGTAEPPPGFQLKLESSKGSGQLLDDSTRSEMESKMGADFSGVKIHTGSEAHAMNESVNAKAFTHGQDIYFNNSHSPQDKELLAHELVHTVQQRHAKTGSKIHRGPKDPKVHFGVQLFKHDLSTAVLKGLLGDRYDQIHKSSYIAVKAEHTWMLYFKDGNKTLDEAKALNTEFAKTDANIQLNNHFYNLTFSTFNTEYSSFNDPEDKGIQFAFTGSLDLLSVALDGGDLDVDLAKLTGNFTYEINKDNIDTQYEFIKGLLQKTIIEGTTTLYDQIKEGKRTIEGKLSISISIQLKALAKYIKDLKLKGELDDKKKTHEDAEKENRTNAEESKNKKNEARTKANELDQEIREKEGKIKKIKNDKTLSPEEAQKKIDDLEKEIAEKKAKSSELREIHSEEKGKMKASRDAANAEKKAAKKLGKEIVKVEKDISKFKRGRKELINKAKNIVKKFENKVDKHITKNVEKLQRKAAKKILKYTEKLVEKVANKILKKVIIKVAKTVAKLILRAIPIIGWLLLIWDVVELLWDLGTLIYDWITGKEREEGEGDGDGEGEGGSGEDGNGTGEGDGDGGNGNGANGDGTDSDDDGTGDIDGDGKDGKDGKVKTETEGTSDTTVAGDKKDQPPTVIPPKVEEKKEEKKEEEKKPQEMNVEAVITQTASTGQDAVGFTDTKWIVTQGKKGERLMATYTGNYNGEPFSVTGFQLIPTVKNGINGYTFENNYEFTIYGKTFSFTANKQFIKEKSITFN